MTSEEICQVFFEYLRESGLEGVAYGDLWRLLSGRGARIRGSSPKNQRDTVYRVLTSNPRIVKTKPGFFAPA